MKKQLLSGSAFLLALALLVSCQKSSISTDETGTPKKAMIENSESNSIARLPPGGGTQGTKSWVTLNSSNEYVTSYGFGINFGTSLPHPSDPDPTGAHDGELIPTIQSLSPNGIPLFQMSVSGAYFVVVGPVYTDNPVTMAQVTQYFKDVHSYWGGDLPTHPTLPPININGTGVQQMSGMLVRDHNSPTGMSCVQDKPTLKS